MPADETAVADARVTRRLRRADVRHGRRSLVASSTAATCAGSAATGRRDDHEVGTLAPRPPTTIPRQPRPRRLPRCRALPSRCPSRARLRRPPRAPRARRTRRSDRCRRLPASPAPSLADRAAHQLGQRADLVREIREVRRGNLLRTVAERVVGSGCTSMMSPSAPAATAARAIGGTSCHAARGVGRVDDDRQVAQLLEHRDRRDVERVARRGLERADAALAEDDVDVAAAQRCTRPTSATPRSSPRCRA